MRLVDIKRSINIAFENFHPKFSSNNTGTYYIDDIQKVKVAIRELDHIGFLHIKDSDDDLLAQINASITNRFILNGIQNEAYKTLFDRLSYSNVMLHQWINNYVTTEETEKTINIKLPQTNELREFSITIDLLERALSEISIINGGGEIKIEQLDHGSLWIIISVCSMQIVKAISKAANAALDIAKKKVELDLMKETLKRSKIETQAIESYVKLQETIINQLLQEYSEQLEDQKEEDSNGLAKAERRNRYKKALDELTTLISAGAEFHPSLTAAQEIIDEFPKFDRQVEFKTPIADLPRNKEDDHASLISPKEDDTQTK